MSQLLSVDGVTVEFHARKRLLSTVAIRALDSVSLRLEQSETLALVGESGSGKTTLGRVCLRLLRPTRGTVAFEGRDITGTRERDLKGFRHRAQGIFQDPFSSLDPYMAVGQIVEEPLLIHGEGRRDGRMELVHGALEEVKLTPPAEMAAKFPHMLSGGQRQRVAIARALALEPKMLILDEPTSALDVSVQAQVLNLLLNLQKRLGLTYLFISHDLSVIRYMCDRVAVVYLGRVMEIGWVKGIFENPSHPYTQALLSAMPKPDPTHVAEEIVLKGELSTLGAMGQGCRFAPRCFAEKLPRCTEEEPELRVLDGDHRVACHLFD